MRRQDRTRMRVGFGLAMMLGFGFATPASACQEVLALLGRAGFQSNSFGRQLQDLSQELAQIYDTEGTPQAGGKGRVARSTERWMEMYLAHYQSPPPRLARHGAWKAKMDSVSGQISRLARFYRNGNHEAGHRQLEVLQRTFAGFSGRTTVVLPGGIGDMAHVVTALEMIEGDHPEANQERIAHAHMLEGFYVQWLRGCGALCQGAAGATGFGAAIDAYRDDVTSGEAPRQAGALPRLATALKAAQAARQAAVSAAVSPPTVEEGGGS